MLGQWLLWKEIAFLTIKVKREIKIQLIIAAKCYFMLWCWNGVKRVIRGFVTSWWKQESALYMLPKSAPCCCPFPPPCALSLSLSKYIYIYRESAWRTWWVMPVGHFGGLQGQSACMSFPIVTSISSWLSSLTNISCIAGKHSCFRSHSLCDEHAF